MVDCKGNGFLGLSCFKKNHKIKGGVIGGKRSGTVGSL